MDIQQLQRKNEELAILNSIAQDLNREVTLNKALDTTLKKVVQLLHLQSGWIWLLSPENQSVYLAASWNFPAAFVNDPSLLSGTCYCVDKYLTGTMEDAANISEITCSRLKNLTEGTDGLRYHSSVPLYSRERKIGILNVVSPYMQELAEDDLNLLYTIGDMLSIAIERAYLFENSKKLGVVEERNRLAREIHDTLAQGLSAISLKLETLEALLEGESKGEKIQALVNQTLQLTKTNLEEARRSVLDLRASPLQEYTLAEALQKLLKEKCTGEKPEFIFQIIGIPGELPLRTEMGIYRIAQELIQNAIRHADASQLNVQLTFEEGTVQLMVQDNGHGFDPGTVKNNRFGLVGVNERVKLLHGTLEIDSAVGKGTRIRIIIPVKDS